MTNEEFAGFAASQGWKCVDQFAFGLHRGYPFAAALQPGRVSVIKVSFHGTRGPTGKGLTMKAVRTLGKSLPKGSSFTQPVVGQFQLTCGGEGDLLTQNLRTSMDLLTESMQEAGLILPKKCPCCNKDDCDSLAMWGGLYTPVHRACIETRAGRAAVEAEVNQSNGSYVTGLIGAFLGGLVGILPTILTVALMERVYSLLYALIPICAYQGYKLLRGRMNKGAFWVTCLVSVFHLFSIEQITFYMAIVEEFGVWPSPLETIQFYWSIATPQAVMADMAISFVFLALGIWIAWGRIRMTATGTVQNMGVIRESLTSYTARPTADL